MIIAERAHDRNAIALGNTPTQIVTEGKVLTAPSWFKPTTTVNNNTMQGIQSVPNSK